MALQGVGLESEIESVRFHGRGVTALRCHGGTREHILASRLGARIGHQGRFGVETRDLANELVAPLSGIGGSPSVAVVLAHSLTI